MILFELCGQTESNAVYQQLSHSNYSRQLGVLQSLVEAAISLDRPVLSQTVVKALNYHAMACLHSYAGEYRPCSVKVGDFEPPAHYRVDALMDDFINVLNRQWESVAPVELSAFTLWRLNWIHPFINGNGRTARAASHFVLCVKAGGWLGGENMLPLLLHQNRPLYVAALKACDKENNQDPLALLIWKLLRKQASP